MLEIVNGHVSPLGSCSRAVEATEITAFLFLPLIPYICPTKNKASRGVMT